MGQYAHRCDEDCAPHLLDDGTCDVCGVAHGEPCDRCGGRGYHRDDCAEVEPRAALCDRCWLPGVLGARCDRPDVLRAMLCEGTVVEVPPAGVARCVRCGRRHVNLGDECADCAVDAMLPATVRIAVEPMRELIASGER